MADRPSWRRQLWALGKRVRRVTVGRPLASLRVPPTVMVVGAQRSGTTSLYRLLQSHPQIVWPQLIKSPHWFDVNYDQTWEWYLSHFPLRVTLGRGDTRRITGEAAPYYLFHPYAAERIARHVPEARVIAILRDPVSRAWSHYQHEVARGHEDLDFEAALDAEPLRLRGSDEVLARPGGVHDGHLYHSYVGRGLYAQQLKRYDDLFDRSQVFVTFTADIKQEPQRVFDEICRFLDISPIPLATQSHHHARRYDSLPPHLRERLEDQFAAPDRELEQLLGQTPPWMTGG